MDKDQIKNFENAVTAVIRSWLTDKSLISPNKSGSLKLNSVSSLLML